jgi:hypothetical protein
MAYGNVKYDAPVTGTDVRFDDVGSGSNVQAVKLLDGTAGSNVVIPGTLANGLLVDVSRVSGNVTVINAGTFATQSTQAGTWNIGTVTAVTGITNPVAVIGTFWQAVQDIEGNVAHDAADSGNPLKIGGVARDAHPAAVAAGDRVDGLYDLIGRFGVYPGKTWSEFNQPAVATQATASRAQAGAGIRNVCTALSFYVTTVSAPTAADVIFNLRDGASGAGTVLQSWIVRVPATASWNLTYPAITGLWIVGTAATAMTLQTSAAPGANIRAGVNLHGTTTA